MKVDCIERTITPILPNYMEDFMEKRALRHLLDLLAIEGPTGRESEVAACIKEKLIQAGCKKLDKA